MSTFYVTEAMNLFVGLHDPSKSKHLTLAEMKLPDLAGIYADHHAGGSMVGIEVNVGVSKLEPTFKLNGVDPDLLTEFMSSVDGTRRKIFTAYGAVRDQRSGRVIECKTVIEGELGRVAPDAFQRGELQGHEYAINGVTHYEVHFDGASKIEWDWFTSLWRINGVDQNADVNRVLRIGG